MASLLDDQDGTFLVLRNDEGQMSLWPASIDTPAGWVASHGPAARDECLRQIEETWVDMRPVSLQLAMQEDVSAA